MDIEMSTGIGKGLCQSLLPNAMKQMNAVMQNWNAYLAAIEVADCELYCSTTTSPKMGEAIPASISWRRKVPGLRTYSSTPSIDNVLSS